MADTYADIWNRVLLRAPDVGPLIAQDFVRNAWRRLQQKRRWSWLVQYAQWISPAVYSTGTVAVTQGSTTVTGSGTAWSSTQLYRQFRIGVTAPIYTITAVDAGAQTLTLNYAYGGATAPAGTSYEIYQCFFPVPENFRSLITVWDPQNNWRLNLDVKQDELNMFDAQRANRGQAFLVSYRDTSIYYTGYTSGPGVPRYELWPHAVGYTWPYLYESRESDLGDPAVSLPRTINGDLLLELALAEAASWPGTTGKPNSYFSRAVSARHDDHAKELINEAELKDDETDMQDLMRQYNVPEGLAVPWGDSAWLQKHAVGW